LGKEEIGENKMFKRKIYTKEEIKKRILDKKRYGEKLILGGSIGAGVGALATGGSPLGIIGGAGVGTLLNIETKKSREKMLEKELKRQRKLEAKLRKV
jgi:hypothetical protein